jgi:sec-independent protein translocase protein TatA
MVTALPAFVPGLPGGPELLIVLGVVVLLFGASKLPSLARSFGQAGGEFKKGREEVERDLADSAAADGEEEQAAETTAADA